VQHPRQETKVKRNKRKRRGKDTVIQHPRQETKKNKRNKRNEGKGHDTRTQKKK
jgi:hypothetical protein